MADYAGLQYQVQSLRTHGGKMEAVDEWLLEPPQNSQVTNARFDTTGAIGKRFGQESLDGSAINTDSGYPHAVYPAKGVLYAATADGTYVRDNVGDTWFQTGLTSPRVSRAITDSLVRQNGTIVAPDVAFVGDLGCVVWSEQLDEDRTLFSGFYQFFDANTLAVLSGPTKIIDSTFEWATTILIAGNEDAGAFWIVGGYSGGQQRIGCYVVANGDYTFDYATRGSTYVAEDIIPFQNSAVVLAKSSGVTAFEQWDTTPSLEWQQVTGQNHLGLALCHNDVSGQFVSLAGDGDIALCDDDGLSTPTVTSVFTVPSHASGAGSGGIARVATISQVSDSGDMVALIGPPFVNIAGFKPYPSFNTSGTTEWGCHIGTCDDGGVVTDEQYLPLVSLVGRAARYTDGRVLVPVAHLQPDAEVYGSMCAVVVEDAGGAPSLAEVARFGVEKISRLNRRIGHSVVHNDAVKFSYNVFTEIEGLIKAQQMADLVQVQPTYAPRFGLANGDSVIAGGVPSLIDGSRHYEASVTTPIIGLPTPNGVGYTGGTDTSISITANTSAVVDPAHIRVVYRFIDANGNIVRSAPSEDYIPFPEDTSPHDPECRLVSKPFPTAIDPAERYLRWDLELHTEDTDGGWGFVGIVTPKDATDATTPPDYPEQLVYFLAETDAAPAGEDTRHYIQFPSFEKPAPGLYPPSWFESRDPPGTVPPLVDVVSVQDRMWGINGEGRQQLRYTNPFEFGLAPEWPTWGSVQIPPDGGEAVAVTAIDDKVIILKRNRAYRVFGDPGTASGEGSSLQVPALISSDVGCVDARTVVEGPWGAVFLSERGFYKLGRDLSMEFVGEAVKDTTAGLVFAAGVAIPSQSQVRWPILSDPSGVQSQAANTLVWDYRQNAWTIWTAESAQHATVVDGVYHRLLRDTASVYRETPDDWSSLPGLFPWAVQTGWIDLTGTQGYQRLKEALFLLRYYSGARLTIAASYDYDDSKADTWSWTQAEMDALVASNGLLQLRVKPGYRKCESVRFSFLEQASFGDATDIGRGVDLVGIDLVVGSKRSAYKSGLAAGAKK